MAESTKATVKADNITDLMLTAGKLRTQANDQLKANKSGSSINTRAVTTTRRQLARTLTKINQLKKANQE